MNIGSILKSKIKKDQIYKNIVNIHKKNDIIKLGLPLGIIILGGTIIYLLKKGRVQND